MAVEVQVPTAVLSGPVDSAGLDPSGWDPEQAVPDQLALRWVEGQPFEAWSVTMLAQIDPYRLPPGDRPRYVALTQKAQSFFAARQARAIAALAGPSDAGKRFDEVDTAAHEVVVALGIPLGAAQTEVYRARRLAFYLPGTRALFEAGELTARHVIRIIQHTGHLSQDECALVEERVLARAAGLPVHEFARRIRRAVARVNPRKDKDRADAAAASSDVTFEPGEDSQAHLISTMPLIDAVTCKTAYDHYALAKKKAGDPRPMGVLRAEAQRVFAEGYLTGALTGTVPTHHGRPVEIHIAVTPDALFGLTDTPAEIPGVGPVPIDTVRAMIHDAKLRWLTISETNGALLDRNPKTWRIPTPVQAFADTAYPTSVGPHSTVPAARCDGEHLIAHPDGPTDTTNIAPMDRGWHRPKTHTPGMHVKRHPDGRIVWTTPLGQSITIDPYDYRLGP